MLCERFINDELVFTDALQMLKCVLLWLRVSAKDNIEKSGNKTMLWVKSREYFSSRCSTHAPPDPSDHCQDRFCKAKACLCFADIAPVILALDAEFYLMFFTGYCQW